MIWNSENKLKRFIEDTIVEISDWIIRPVQSIFGLSQYNAFDKPDTLLRTETQYSGFQKLPIYWILCYWVNLTGGLLISWNKELCSPYLVLTSVARTTSMHVAVLNKNTFASSLPRFQWDVIHFILRPSLSIIAYYILGTLLYNITWYRDVKPPLTQARMSTNWFSKTVENRNQWKLNSFSAFQFERGSYVPTLTKCLGESDIKVIFDVICI